MCPLLARFTRAYQRVWLTGLLEPCVPERDSGKLAAAILCLLEDQNSWQRYHLATQEHIDRQFDLRKQTALLEDIYTEQIH